MSEPEPLDPLAALYRSELAARGGAGCPPPAALARLAAGAVSRRERRRLADHLGGCARCAEEWRLARALGAWAEGAAAPRPAAPWLPAFAPRLAWAAALVAALGGGLALLRLPAPESAEAVRSLPAHWLAQALVPPDGARLADAPAELVWRRPAPAIVELFDEALVPLGASAGAVSSPWALPEPLKRRLRRRGGRIYWRVVTAGEVGPEPSALALFELPRAAP